MGLKTTKLDYSFFGNYIYLTQLWSNDHQRPRHRPPCKDKSFIVRRQVLPGFVKIILHRLKCLFLKPHRDVSTVWMKWLDTIKTRATICTLPSPSYTDHWASRFTRAGDASRASMPDHGNAVASSRRGLSMVSLSYLLNQWLQSTLTRYMDD